jgi:F-type H+-transporting ATPase subunit c
MAAPSGAALISATFIQAKSRKERKMEIEAAKMIGAGIAALALGGAGIGLGMLFGSYMEGAFRNPEAQSKLKVNPMLAFALIEATGLFGFVIAMIILFG